ncbi:MAG: hypothetical protein IPM34_06085 [Saprospiraceae bacterium]|nr:hypothetical protein [Saprospiraceae bacterium]
MDFFICALVIALGLSIIATHDASIGGAWYYETNGPMKPDPNSESGKWLHNTWIILLLQFISLNLEHSMGC